MLKLNEEELIEITYGLVMFVGAFYMGVYVSHYISPMWTLLTSPVWATVGMYGALILVVLSFMDPVIVLLTAFTILLIIN